MTKLPGIRAIATAAAATAACVTAPAASAAWHMCGTGYVTSLSYRQDSVSTIYIVLSEMIGGMTFARTPVGNEQAVAIRDKSGGANKNFGMLRSAVQSAYLAGSFMSIYSSNTVCDRGDGDFLVVTCSESSDSACE